MKTFTARRNRNIAIVIILAVVILLVERLLYYAFFKTALFTGWLLFSLVVLLAIYNVRKKFPFLPLGSSATWLQIHIGVGLLSIVVFGAHVAWQIPNGALDLTLAGLYVVVAGSGVIGLIISRVFARRITMRGPEVLYERIPRLRNRLRREAENLVLECLAETESTAIPEFYSKRLESFFSIPRNFGAHLFQSLRPRREMLAEIEAHHRFLNELERRYMEKIEDRVIAKDDLDFQFAHQTTLRYWLYIHIPFTYALLVFAVTHVILMYAY